ncbi:TAXI family TRAP transporter solute-binding subunit [Alcaligenes endophyticus]|uniref:TAXI family TRAP transporter solute-binding subunit n=1 Tax=Alcaligenes endophyticus TaxID=1929088 RepID=A0ABT8EEI9_9BURK|nr:TAXI family TRAP transporter solute-binding subunit [Alcaligenes endophyticus]MCX5592258.1 TAXI family TRAP transporter solute-binding subunit [Alcaligenes endophyticus]MDN4119700.1 TAXI family TRAP transporter solute-binding subunit [Alcaligenes endophyticus]
MQRLSVKRGQSKAVLWVALSVLGVLAVHSSRVDAQTPPVDIGTGSASGVYYSAGGAICRLVNKDSARHGVACTVEPTGGSVFNVAALRSKEFNFGIVQSDVAYNAYHGQAQFKDIGAFTQLRSVFSLYPEPLTIVARKEAHIQSFADFKGKRFSVGNPGSVTRESMDKLLAAKGLEPQFFSLRAQIRAEEQGAALCNNQIDGFSYSVGHPSALIQDSMVSCGAQLVPLEGAEIDALVARYPYYAKITIPGGLYLGNQQDINTYGVLASLMTSADVPDETVYNVVKAVFENFDDFKRLHMAFNQLQKVDMVRNGLAAPLHPGAERYFKEVGLL